MPTGTLHQWAAWEWNVAGCLLQIKHADWCLGKFLQWLFTIERGEVARSPTHSKKSWNSYKGGIPYKPKILCPNDRTGAPQSSWSLFDQSKGVNIQWLKCLRVGLCEYVAKTRSKESSRWYSRRKINGAVHMLVAHNYSPFGRLHIYCEGVWISVRMLEWSLFEHECNLKLLKIACWRLKQWLNIGIAKR